MTEGTARQGERVAIMQPYFFPYLGYFGLIKHTDRFIVFDPVQFIRHGWIERNRISRQTSGWLYVRVPLKHHRRATLIRDVRIDNTKDWRRSILSQLAVYKRRAPYYCEVVALVAEVFSGEYDDIVSLDVAALREVCGYLGIGARLDVFSEMDLPIEAPKAPDEWALNICQALGNVAEYWNAPGGREFFDSSKYTQAGIELRFPSVRLREYDQGTDAFEPGLSILDVMMFNPPEEIGAMLDDYVLLEGVDRSSER